MNDWLHNLPIVWMALLVFGLTALVTAAIYVVVMVLSVGERARSFKAVSPGLLPPLGILFALFVAFTATQVWTDNDKANSVVDREASAIRTVVILSAAFPGEPETRLRNLIRSYVADAIAQEWPMMAHRTATLQVIPYSLAEALQLTLTLTPSSQGQQTAQREITTSLENALDARRQRIIISQSEVNWVKWLCLGLQAVCALLAIAMVHSDNRLATAITMGLFGVGVAVSLLLILAYDRPFTGELAVSPNPLLQVMPALGASQERSSLDPVMGNRMSVNGTKQTFMSTRPRW
jgi:multisubunit Na+/H+ antiporter MnhB subunit